MDRFIGGLPKAELHVHIEGTLEPSLRLKLAERNKVSLSHKTEKDIRKSYSFKNLQSFLTLFYQGASVLISERDFADLTLAYLTKAAEQNVRHAEIFFDPQTHTARGLRIETVVNGILEGMTEAKLKHGITAKPIPCFLRDRGPDEAMKTLEELSLYLEWFPAVGLDSTELHHPPAHFKKVFAQARSNGLATVAHAGEEGPPEYISQALDQLKVTRIDHGVRCLEDDRLVRRLAKEKVPLTVCPLSNVRLGVFPDLARHNLKKLIENGVVVTINSDDPAYFGGYINENFIESQKALNLTREQIIDIARHSFNASFLTPEEKSRHLQAIDDYAEHH